MLRPFVFLLVAGMLIMSKAGYAQPQPVTTVEGISEYRLENGMKILLFPDISKPQITVNMTVLVGSRHEGYGEAGMAHLLEHLLFKGTPKYPDIAKVLKDLGADYNGTTWLDRTNYYETLPASDENLELALSLESERLQNSFVRKEDLDTEMSTVRNEFEMGENSPSGILGQRIMSAAFLWHNYGKSTIGNRADIERVPIDRLKAFYKKHYQPDNVVLIVAGAFEEEKALQLIDQYFGSIPRPERELEKTYTEEPTQDGDRFVTLRRVGDVGIAGAVYHIPPGGHPDYVPVDVLEYILTSSPSGRLYQSLVETKLAAKVSGSAFALHDPGVIRFSADANSGVSPQDVLSRMLEVIETIGDEGVTEEEVKRAKTHWLKVWEKALNDSSETAIQLSEWAAQGDWRLFFLYRDRLEAVTVEQVNEVARKYLLQSNRTAGVFIPTPSSNKAVIPQAPNLAEMLEGYQGREGVSVGEAFEVTPENIEARTERVVLKSGVKASFLPKKTRGQSVVLNLTLRYGSAESLKNLKVATETMPQLMLRGTKNLSRQQIQDALDESRSTLAQQGTPGEATFRLETRREKLPEAIEILRQILREPTFPASELEIIRNARLSQNEQMLTDPTSLVRLQISKALSAGYSQDDPRYVATIPEQIEQLKAVTVENVVDVYSRLLSGSHGEVAVVGDFETAEIQPLIENLLADWKTSEQFEYLRRSGDIKLNAERIEILVPEKENSTYFAGTVFPMNDQNPDYPSLIIGNYLMGVSGLSSRLGNRVRQKEGLSYSIGSGVNASAIDDRTTFMFYAITNPKNMGRVETAIREEIDLLLKDGITPAELDDAKKGYLESMILERSDDNYLSSLLNSTSFLGRTMKFYSDRESQISGLTTDSVHSALKKWLKPDEIVVGVAGNFSSTTDENPATTEMPKTPSETKVDMSAESEFQTTDSGLKYKIITEGTGKAPSSTSTVQCHYRGWLDSGKEFDSSYGGQPIEFPLNRVIAGWTEGLQLIKEGGKIELEIPSNLGYGKRGAPPVIPADATLHFEVELFKVK